MDNKFENRDNKIINQGKNTIGVQNIYLNNDESKDWGIIEEIFKYVFSEIVKNEEYDISNNKYLNLPKKIPLNFTKKDTSQKVKQLFSELYLRIILVDKFISLSNQQQVIALYLDIRRKYCSLLQTDNWETPVRDYRIFEKLAEQYLPDNKKSNPDYFANAEALILFFFEHCEFGKKTEEENNNQSTLLL